MSAAIRIPGNRRRLRDLKERASNEERRDDYCDSQGCTKDPPSSIAIGLIANTKYLSCFDTLFRYIRTGSIFAGCTGNGEIIMDNSMHHAATGTADSDKDTPIQPVHPGGDSGSHQAGAGSHMSTIWKISKNGSSYPRLSPSRSFFFHRSSSRFWDSGLIFPVPGTLPSPLPPLSIFMAGIRSSTGLYGRCVPAPRA